MKIVLIAGLLLTASSSVYAMPRLHCEVGDDYETKDFHIVAVDRLSAHCHDKAGVDYYLSFSGVGPGLEYSSGDYFTVSCPSVSQTRLEKEGHLSFGGIKAGALFLFGAEVGVAVNPHGGTCFLGGFLSAGVGATVALGKMEIGMQRESAQYRDYVNKFQDSSNSSLTQQTLEGAYVGRCFNSGTTDYGKKILMFLQTYQDINSCDQSVTWKMVVRDANYSDESGDTQNFSEVLLDASLPQVRAGLVEFWKDYATLVDPVLFSNGVASGFGTEGGPALVDVKNGEDGLIYGVLRNEPGGAIVRSCQFYKKVL